MSRHYCGQFELIEGSDVNPNHEPGLWECSICGDRFWFDGTAKDLDAKFAPHLLLGRFVAHPSQGNPPQEHDDLNDIEFAEVVQTTYADHDYTDEIDV